MLLIRHCESSGQHPDAPLTARGLEQAEELAQRLAPLAPDHLVSSPYRRAHQSVAPLAAMLGVAVTTDARWRERQLGDAPLDDWRGAVRDSFDDLDRVLPGGESSRAAQARARAALDALLTAPHRLPAVATHGNLLALLLTSIDGQFGYAGWESLTNPDVYAVEFTDRGWRYRRL
ncbi:MAG: histidine phosphatase family protein [Deltaproteobacteria bacterium]|nr:histidine phosphatase family protein [Deltaproteobacteria bacterium]